MRERERKRHAQVRIKGNYYPLKIELWVTPTCGYTKNEVIKTKICNIAIQIISFDKRKRSFEDNRKREWSLEARNRKVFIV